MFYLSLHIYHNIRYREVGVTFSWCILQLVAKSTLWKSRGNVLMIELFFVKIIFGLF